MTRQIITVSRPAGDFEIELFDPRPELEVVHFRGLGNRATSAVRLSRKYGCLARDCLWLKIKCMYQLMSHILRVC